MSKFHKKVFSFICVFPARKTNILKGKLRPLAFIAFALLATPLFIALAAQAADICVGPSSDGNGSGSDWNNPKAWSGTPARGDTWYLADGSYSGKTFSVAASGSTLITIKKATLSDHGPSTGWSDTIGDGQATFSGQIDFESSYWVFDGQTGGGPGSWSSGYGFKITETDDASAVILMGYNAPANNITVRHMDMQGKGSPSQQGGLLERRPGTLWGFQHHALLCVDARHWPVPVLYLPG